MLDTPRVLLVEDDDDVRDGLARALVRDGCDVVQARHGGEALRELAIGAVPDVIVLDLLMPEMDGWTFRARQKADARLRAIPVIAMSSDDSPQAVAVDASIYLKKPVSLENLRLAIREAARDSRMEHRDRLVALGRLSAGVSHEIKNPLAALTGAVLLAKRELRKAQVGQPAGPWDRLDEMLTIIGDASARIEGIVRDVTVFARTDVESRPAIDVRSVIESTVRLLRGQFADDVSTELDLAPVPFVLANPTSLGQVILNLLSNAADATAEAHGGIIRVRTYCRDGAHAVIEIADDGPGMTPATRARLFEPFFTTKPVGAGTGLGLSLSKKIVEAIGGHIEVDTALGAGTTFRVRLPAVVSGTQAAVHHTIQKNPELPSILIVDDEEGIRKTLARLLDGKAIVTCAGSAAEARSSLDTTDYDIVLCDINMPGGSGLTLYHQLQDRPVADAFVFMTGGAVPTAARATSRPVLAKPFDIDALFALVAHRSKLASGA